MELETELTRALTPARAPALLWDRIESRLDARAPQRVHIGWGVAAGMVIALGAAWLALPNRAPVVHAAVTEFQRVCGDRGGLDVETTDPAKLRQWAARQGIPFPAGMADHKVQLAGASALRDRPGIAVAYRADNAWSALVVEPGSMNVATKKMERHTIDGLTVFTWHAGGHRYTLVTSHRDRAEKACGLCHRA